MSEPRGLICARCGASFDCRPDGACWCADESFRLPVPGGAAPGGAAPGDDTDCLCPACLRAEAARRQEVA
jgi:Cysteine-rich CWC